MASLFAVEAAGGDATEVRGVVAVLIGLPAERLDELAILREDQDLPVGLGVGRRVAAAVPADPDVALGIDQKPVITVRPIVPGARTAPAPEELALDIELENRRSLRAALTGFQSSRILTR